MSIDQDEIDDFDVENQEPAIEPSDELRIWVSTTKLNVKLTHFNFLHRFSVVIVVKNLAR